MAVAVALTVVTGLDYVVRPSPSARPRSRRARLTTSRASCREPGHAAAVLASCCDRAGDPRHRRVADRRPAGAHLTAVPGRQRVVPRRRRRLRDRRQDDAARRPGDVERTASSRPLRRGDGRAVRDAARRRLGGEHHRRRRPDPQEGKPVGLVFVAVAGPTARRSRARSCRRPGRDPRETAGGGRPALGALRPRLSARSQRIDLPAARGSCDPERSNRSPRRSGLAGVGPESPAR